MVIGIQQVPGSRKLLFGGRVMSNKPPEPVQIKKVLLLLYAAEIISFAISYAPDDSDKTKPIVVEFSCDIFFKRISIYKC